jgi:hypothetical protein
VVFGDVGFVYVGFEDVRSEVVAWRVDCEVWPDLC